MKQTTNRWDGLFKHGKQELMFNNIRIIVEDGVFTPDPNITYSTSIIINNLPLVSGLRVADIGTGSGVIAVIVASKGAKEVIATDISDTAIKNTEENVKLNNLLDKVIVLKTNFLEDVNGRFDLIIANLPILDEVWGSQPDSSKSTLESFINEAKPFLNIDGRILIPLASFIDVKATEKIFERCGYSFNIKKEEKLGYTWYLYTLTVKGGS